MARGTPNRRKLYKKKLRQELRRRGKKCAGKRVYKDPQVALVDATRMVRETTLRGAVYVCRWCGELHITSKPRGLDNEIFLVEREE